MESRVSGIDRAIGECTWDGIAWGEEYQRWNDEEGVRIRYRDWTPETSRVVSGPLGGYSFPGRSFPDRPAAREYWLSRASRIIEEYLIPGRWALRIPT